MEISQLLFVRKTVVYAFRISVGIRMLYPSGDVTLTGHDHPNALCLLVCRVVPSSCEKEHEEELLVDAILEVSNALELH